MEQLTRGVKDLEAKLDQNSRNSSKPPYSDGYQKPSPNSETERALRPAKTKQKAGGCFRTFEVAKIYARIQGFIASVRKQQQNLFPQLKIVFTGKQG